MKLKKKKMNSYEIDYCKRIMDKIESWKVAPQFFQDISVPLKSFGNQKAKENNKSINFPTIRSSLINNLLTKEQWIKNMRMFFQTIKNQYREESIISLIAADMNNWFEKKIKIFPKNSQEEWLLKYAKIQKEADAIIKNSPIH